MVYANTIPSGRSGPPIRSLSPGGALVALLVALIGERTATGAPLLALAMAVIAALLDGLDGWLARRHHMASAFGARFDMETDALLIMVLSVLAWQFGKAGVWVLATGLLRYLFVAAGFGLPWLRRPLPPSQRRKIIAAVQMVTLNLTIAPFIPTTAASCIAAVGLGVLSLSFLVDTQWLIQNATSQSRRVGLKHGLYLLLAVVVLNGSVTFHNIWPTLGIHWPGELSVEFGVLLLALAMSNAWLGQTHRRVLALLSAVVVLFALGRYAYVTVQALYGRDINLYWDGPQFAAVTGMFVRVASLWVVLGVCVGTVAVLGVLYVVARWSLGHVDESLREQRAARWGFGAAGLALVTCFFAQQLSDAVPRVPRFSIPVSRTFVAQIGRVADGSPADRTPHCRPRRPSIRVLRRSMAVMCCWCSWSRMAALPMTVRSSGAHWNRHGSDSRLRFMTRAAAQCRRLSAHQPSVAARCWPT